MCGCVNVSKSLLTDLLTKNETNSYFLSILVLFIYMFLLFSVLFSLNNKTSFFFKCWKRSFSFMRLLVISYMRFTEHHSIKIIVRFALSFSLRFHISFHFCFVIFYFVLTFKFNFNLHRNQRRSEINSYQLLFFHFHFLFFFCLNYTK